MHMRQHVLKRIVNVLTLVESKVELQLVLLDVLAAQTVKPDWSTPTQAADILDYDQESTKNQGNYGMFVADSAAGSPWCF